MTDAPDLPAEWTDPERWAWGRIAAGQPADFDARARETDPAAADLDPRRDAGWNADRRLGAGFLRTILTGKRWVDATPFGGVRILGALVDDAAIDLEHARLQRLLWLERSRIRVPFRGRALRVDGELSFDRCAFAAEIDLYGASLKEALTAGYALFEGEVDLSQASIGSNLLLFGSEFDQAVGISGTTVGNEARLSANASFRNGLDMTTARVGGVLDLSTSTVRGKLGLVSIRVGGTLNLWGLRLRGPLDLLRASIGADLDISAAQIAGEASLNGISVTGAVFLNKKSVFRKRLDLGNASVGVTLEMSGSRFGEAVVLNSITVSGAAFLDDGATFRSSVELDNARLGSSLLLQGGRFLGSLSLTAAIVANRARFDDLARFEQGVDLTDAALGSLNMNGSSFGGDVDLTRTAVKGEARFGPKAAFEGALTLTDASVGSLQMGGSTYKAVSLNRTSVQGRAFLDDHAVFEGELDAGSASIGSNLTMSTSVFRERVTLNGAKIAGGLFIRDWTRFEGELDMTLTSVGPALYLMGSTFAGKVSLYGATVAGDAFLTESEFLGTVEMRGARIGSHLHVASAHFHEPVDLAGTRIEGELRLATDDQSLARWEANAALLLRNARCGTLQDWWQETPQDGAPIASWPGSIDLEGFSCGRFGSGNATEANMLARPSSSQTGLLGRSATFSPQPYEFLARAFREAGEPEKANDLLYDSRERRRRGLWRSNRLGWLGMSVLKWTIGYGLGLRYFRVIYWVLGLTVVGMLLLHYLGAQPQKGWLQLFFVSLDDVLPVVTLDRAHEDIVRNAVSAGGTGTPQPDVVWFYFQIHRLAGWLLGSFLVAGLAGLTQKS